MLKTNSRFACLVENLGPKMEKNMDTNKKRNTPPNRERYPDKNTKKNSFQKKIGYEMDINHFPALSSTPDISTTDNIDINESYIENLTKPTKQADVLTFEELNPGWISINGSSLIICKSKSKSNKAPVEPRYMDMLNRINTNYVNYKENYIELWGQEEYEHMFLFPNYNYYEYDDYTDDEEEDDDEEYDDEY